LDLLLEYDDEDEQTLANLIYRLFIQPFENNELQMVSQEKLTEKIYSAVPFLEQLFPRLLNRIFASYKGLHAEADVQEQMFVDTLSERIKKRQLAAIREQGGMPEMLMKMLEDSKAHNLHDFHNWQMEQKLAWLWNEEDFQAALASLLQASAILFHGNFSEHTTSNLAAA
jgi:hypothetical protein